MTKRTKKSRPAAARAKSRLAPAAKPLVPAAPGKPRVPAATAVCPVNPAAQGWIESSLGWFAEQFGDRALRRDTVVPTASFLAERQYSGTADQIKALVRHVCSLMAVDPGLIRVDLFDGSEEKKAAQKFRRKRAIGHFHMEQGRAVIAVDQNESSDPRLVTAIAAHELCHFRLQGEGRVSYDRPDGERLTDLLTVYFGFGIFTTNAAMSFARADRNWIAMPTGDLDDRTLNAARNEGYHRVGYLNSAEFGYALACYSWLRREADPDWARNVNPGPLVSMSQGLAFLAQSAVSGALPAQRLIGSSVKVNNATIYIGRSAKKTGPTSL